MYVIKKTINNNVVLVYDSKFQESILFGSGVGYNKKVGDLVEQELIEKKYLLFDGNEKYLVDYLQDVSYELIQVCNEIREYVEEEYEIYYNSYMFFSMLDHMHNAIERHNNNLKIQDNTLTSNLQSLDKEYILSRKIGEMFENKLNITLNEVELNFIALHFVTFFYDIKYADNIEKIYTLVEKILIAIEKKYPNSLDNNFTKKRFVTHLEHFILKQSNTATNFDTENKDDLYDLLSSQYSGATQMLYIIIDIFEIAHINITEQEKTYLLIHLVKIIKE